MKSGIIMRYLGSIYTGSSPVIRTNPPDCCVPTVWGIFRIIMRVSGVLEKAVKESTVRFRNIVFAKSLHGNLHGNLHGERVLFFFLFAWVNSGRNIVKKAVSFFGSALPAAFKNVLVNFFHGVIR